MFFKSITCLLFLLGLEAAEVPSYIQLCSRRDPNLDQCVLKSIHSLREKLVEGIPEMRIPPIDPVTIDKLTLINLPNFITKISDIRIYGCKNFNINRLHVDLDKQQVNIDLDIENSTIDARYNVTAKILVTITGTGAIHIIPSPVNAKAVMKFKHTTKDGKVYLEVASIKTKIHLDDFEAKLDSDQNNPTIQAAISQVLGSTKPDIIKTISPYVEKAIAETTLLRCNRIFSRFSYDELLPDIPV